MPSTTFACLNIWRSVTNNDNIDNDIQPKFAWTFQYSLAVARTPKRSHVGLQRQEHQQKQNWK